VDEVASTVAFGQGQLLFEYDGIPHTGHDRLSTILFPDVSYVIRKPGGHELIDDVLVAQVESTLYHLQGSPLMAGQKVEQLTHTLQLFARYTEFERAELLYVYGGHVYFMPLWHFTTPVFVVSQGTQAHKSG
jgi:hypothetical protein